MSCAYPRFPVARLFSVLAVTLALACTYGPPEHRVTVEQVVRLGDTYQALVVVRHDTFRPPTGLSAFPDGGKARYERRGSATHWIDARSLTSRLLIRVEAPDSVWESHGARIAGLGGDSVAYLRLTGCPRGGECYPGIDRTAVFRLTLSGGVTRVDSVPAGTGLPGSMAARAPGEQAYVRFGTRGDSVTARFEEGVERRVLFRAGPGGSLTAIPRVGAGGR